MFTQNMMKLVNRLVSAKASVGDSAISNKYRAANVPSFVSSPAYLKGFVHQTRLRKLMAVGSRLDTPLDKKAIVIATGFSENGYFITEVSVKQSDGVYVNVKLSPDTQISTEKWVAMTTPVSEFEEWKKEHDFSVKIRNAIAELESAARMHGKVLKSVEGSEANNHDLLRKYGETVTKSRTELHRILGIV